MKTFFILVLLFTGMYSYAQVVESLPVSTQQAQTPLPAADENNKAIKSDSRQEEVIIENKPVRIGEPPVRIPNTENKKTKESEPVQNIPVRKEEKIQAIPK